MQFFNINKQQQQQQQTNVHSLLFLFDYTYCRAYPSIRLLCCMGIVYSLFLMQFFFVWYKMHFIVAGTKKNITYICLQTAFFYQIFVFIWTLYRSVSYRYVCTIDTHNIHDRFFAFKTICFALKMHFCFSFCCLLKTFCSAYIIRMYAKKYEYLNCRNFLN